MVKYVNSIKFGENGETYVIKDSSAQAAIENMLEGDTFVETDQGIENAGKLLSVDNNGKVVPTTVEIPSVEGLASEQYVDSAIEEVEGKIPSIEGLASEQYVDSALEGKQNVLTAGTNITIENDVISATGGAGASSFSELVGDPMDNSALADALNAKADASDLQSLEDEVDTKQDVIDSEHKLAVALVDGALTSDDLDGYATENYVDTAIADINVETQEDELELDKDLLLQDSEGNVICEFSNGNIKTKNFDSSNIINPTIDLPFMDLKGKLVGFLGDSITAGSGASSTANRYSSKFCEIAGCTERNMGIGGTCLANNTKNGASGSRFLTRVTSANINGLDLLIIGGGTNDFSYDIKPVGDHFEETTITGNTYVGTKKRVANSDNETFSGALHELILAIRAINPVLPIVYWTPLNRANYNSGDPRPASDEQNANGNYLQDFTDAVKDICAFYSIPVFEANQHYFYDFNTGDTTYAGDHLHPNDKGHLVLAKALYRWIITNCAL